MAEPPSDLVVATPKGSDHSDDSEPDLTPEADEEAPLPADNTGSSDRSDYDWLMNEAGSGGGVMPEQPEKPARQAAQPETRTAPAAPDPGMEARAAPPPSGNEAGAEPLEAWQLHPEDFHGKFLELQAKSLDAREAVEWTLPGFANSPTMTFDPGRANWPRRRPGEVRYENEGRYAGGQALVFEFDAGTHPDWKAVMRTIHHRLVRDALEHSAKAPHWLHDAYPALAREFGADPLPEPPDYTGYTADEVREEWKNLRDNKRDQDETRQRAGTAAVRGRAARELAIVEQREPLLRKQAEHLGIHPETERRKRNAARSRSSTRASTER